MINDLKAKSYQQSRILLGKKNSRKRAYLQKVEQENLEKKKEMTQYKMVQTKQIRAKKGELKCLVVHTALKAGNASLTIFP